MCSGRPNPGPVNTYGSPDSVFFINRLEKNENPSDATADKNFKFFVAARCTMLVFSPTWRRHICTEFAGRFQANLITRFETNLSTRRY